MKIVKEFKNFSRDISAGAAAEFTCLMINPSKKQKTATGFTVFLTTVACAMQPLYAEGNFVQQLANTMKKIYGWMIGLSAATAAIFIGIAFFQYMVSGDPATTRAAKSRAIRVIVGLILLNAIGAIITTSQDLTQGSGFDGYQSHASFSVQ